MVVGDDQFDTLEAARLQADEKVPPGRAALAAGHLDGQDLAPSVPVDADRDSTAWLMTTPASRTFS